MNDLDDRLTDLLARSAAAVPVRPDVDAVLTGDHGGSPLVDLGRRPRDTRRLLALAAAVLVVLGLAAVAVVVSRADETRERAQAPAAAGRFPVLGHLPAELEGEHVEANDGAGTHRNALDDTFDPDTPVVRAALGRVGDDGAVLDVVQLVAGAEDAEARPGPQPPQVDDLGGGYALATGSGVLEVRGPGTVVEVYGTPNAEALMRAIVGTTLTATVGPDGAPVLALGDLPDGYTVIAPPAAPEAEQAEISVPASPPCDAPSRSLCDARNATVVVETGVGAPELAVMSAGLASPVDIGGGRGLMATSAGDQTVTRIAWTAPSGVTVSLWTTYDTDEALAIARGVALVDEATWRATYPEWPDGTVDDGSGSDTTEAQDGTSDTTEAESDESAGTEQTTEPIPGVVGRPASPFARPSTDGEEVTFAGHWTVVGMTRSGCEDGSWCADAVLDAMVGLDHDPSPFPGVPAPPLLQLVALVEDATGDEAADAVAVGFDDPVVLSGVDEIMQTWGVDDLPAFAVVDPDGIVVGIEVGTVTTPAIAAALAEATDEG